MRSFIFAVAAIVAASWANDRLRAADLIPAFNAEVANVGIEETVADCTKDETDAKNELDKSWPQFGASDKQTCVGESSTGGGQSYVELLTCLEMSSGEFLARGHQISPFDQPVGATDQQRRSRAHFCSVRCRVAAHRAR
jgi:hypothetical protein